MFTLGKLVSNSHATCFSDNCFWLEKRKLQPYKSVNYRIARYSQTCIQQWPTFNLFIYWIIWSLNWYYHVLKTPQKLIKNDFF
jgi:hypothetical protein